MKQDKLIIERLVSKSKDAFLFAIEIINKPTLKHRSENFAFNICNAWELLLKAEIISKEGENSIYYKNDKGRTITLSKCIDKIFTDFKNPIKANIEIIQKLRNCSTHFITPEYDNLYISVFQASVFHYVEHIKKTFNEDINNILPSNFLTIATNPRDLSDIKIIDKVDKATFNKFIKEKKKLHISEDIPGICVSFEVSMKAVKKDSDITYRIDPNATLSTQVINKIMDPSNSHPYRAKNIIEIINSEYGSPILNTYSFQAIRKYEHLEDDPLLYYHHKQSNSKTYSEKSLNIIRKNINGIPNYIELVVSEYKKK